MQAVTCATIIYEGLSTNKAAKKKLGERSSGEKLDLKINNEWILNQQWFQQSVKEKKKKNSFKRSPDIKVTFVTFLICFLVQYAVLDYMV